ncbi:helix-turn-helix transcriptional regulator [Nemorincola caseinilytica]|uniref:Helix-turn-helix transcriptional regulator n=1 Tax=Nemorincola caseinilytica TaxID=2054315 RepID=A0ABP8NCB9_9BACT
MQQQVKNTIPVYDICSLADTRHLREDITAEGLAHYLQRQKDLRFPHRHSFYHLVYFTEGSGKHSIDFETFRVEPGQVYFMIPGQVHSWHFEGRIDGYVINFSEQLMHSFLKEGQYLEQFPFFSGIAAEGVVTLGDARMEVEQLLARVVAEAAGDAPMAGEMIRIYLLSIFITVLRDMPVQDKKQAPGHSHLLLRNFRKLVEQYYAAKRLPKEYAAMLYITPNHLNALCNDLLGRSAGEVIRDRVLLEAKRLLVGHGISVAEIAWQLNFSDNSYFTKFFKKYTGMTPEQFRARPESEK